MSVLLRCYPGDRPLEFLLVVALTVALTSSLGWLSARLLSGKPALRHLALFAALLGCLASPALAWLCAAADVTLVRIPVVHAEQGKTTSHASRTEAAPLVPAPRKITNPPPGAVTPPAPLATSITEPTASPVAALPANQVPTAPLPPAPAPEPAERHVALREVAAGTAFAWAAGALLMLARLTWNAGRVIALRRSSLPLQDHGPQSLLRGVAAELGMRRFPLLLVSGRPVAPLAVGLGRPAIILPERLLPAITRDQLRDVLIHEAAHLRRGDQRSVLLQALAGALYWPIVSVHVLNRELRRAREEICDNAVLAVRDAICYGETLLQVAQVLTHVPPTSAAVGVLGGPGELERRVAGLLRPGRSTMTTTGRPTAFAVLSLFLAGAMLASATRFAASAPANRSASPPRQKPDSNRPVVRPADRVRRDGDAGQTIVLHGKILGPGNRPVAGARLYLSTDEWSDPVELGRSGADGAYRLAVPEAKLRRTVTGSFQYGDCQAALVATTDGLGSGWVELPSAEGSRYGPMKPEYDHDLHLAADFPVAGWVVGPEGKPVAGAVVAVDAVFALADPRWWKLPAAIRAGNPGLMSRPESDCNNWFSRLYPTAWKMIPAATTDAEGRFQIAGVGGDRVVRLRVSGPGVRSTLASILTRDDVADFTRNVRVRYPRTPRPHGYYYPERKTAPEGDQGVLLFGPTPKIEVDPARTVAGVVRDASTGEPIAGMEVRVADAYGAGSAVTDRHGRYRILRAEDEASLLVYVRPDPPDRYLTVVRRLAEATRLGEIVADFDVPRGVVIRGRVLEAGNGKPVVSAPRQGCHDVGPGPLVAGNVSYYPLATNTELRGKPTGLYFEGLHSRTNYPLYAAIDPDGKFRIAVPPGPGVLLAQSGPGVPMIALLGPSKEGDGYHRLFPYPNLSARAQGDGAPPGDVLSLPGLNGPIPLGNHHAYRVINPPADAMTLDLTLTVPRPAPHAVQFVGADGRPIRGVRVNGLAAALTMAVVLDGAEAEILALETGKQRELIATSSDGKYAARTLVRTDDPQPTVIRLRPAASDVGPPEQ